VALITDGEGRRLGREVMGRTQRLDKNKFNSRRKKALKHNKGK